MAVADQLELQLQHGTIIAGKWKGGRYRIERLLGEGANGKVYLVESRGRRYALKVGADAVDLQSEINGLQALARQGTPREEPFLVEVDDFRDGRGHEYPFYVMRYVRGKPLADYIAKEGPEWVPLIGYHLLMRLAALHEAGWVFGDLKPDNVLVAEYGRAQLVDYGGVTAIGSGVRQFTEVFDRGYWSAGSRTADPQYDLFSFAVLFIQLVEGKRLDELTRTLLPHSRVPAELLRLAEDHPVLAPARGWLRRALQGEFGSAREAAASWQRELHRARVARPAGSGPRWLGGLFVASALLLATTIFWLVR
ncbi:phosphotransferase [Paenibacillus sp. IB182496]|uniref:non-specific serine/threonine protein kinase n=2 Tax=Paenibacillus sabuli TaxID=2772509 RepID=A0A927GU06_9BACL|nr:phosphotransferase [Paenibacillus sabuli]